MHYLLPAALLCATTLASLPYAPERLAPSGGDRLGRRSPFPGPGFQKGFLSSKKGFLEPEAHAPAKGKGEGALQRISVQEQHALDQSHSGVAVGFDLAEKQLLHGQLLREHQKAEAERLHKAGQAKRKPVRVAQMHTPEGGGQGKDKNKQADMIQSPHEGEPPNQWSPGPPKASVPDNPPKISSPRLDRQ